MSVLIKGMKMPETAGYCSKKIDPDTRRCNYTGKEFEETLSLLIDRRCADCPLVEVPTPHGRLIDADALNTYDVSPIYEFCVLGVTEEDIGLAPTIIEAEGGDT